MLLKILEYIQTTLQRDCSPQEGRRIFDRFTTVFCMVDPMQQALTQVFGGVIIVCAKTVLDVKGGNA